MKKSSLAKSIAIDLAKTTDQTAYAILDNGEITHTGATDLAATTSISYEDLIALIEELHLQPLKTISVKDFLETAKQPIRFAFVDNFKFYPSINPNPIVPIICAGA